MNAHVIQFPIERRTFISPVDHTERALQAARFVLRTFEEHDDATLREACHVMANWGDPRDVTLARSWEKILRNRRVDPDLYLSCGQAAAIRRQRRHTHFQLIGCTLIFVILLAIFAGAPAKIAATVLQAQEAREW